jgi:nucleoside-diphosphate-sugar epimerase
MACAKSRIICRMLSPKAPILVTGATGFLGGALVRRLRLEGLPVIAHGRDPGRLAALQAKGVRVLAHDLATPPDADVEATFGRVSAVVHCSARSAPHGTAAAFQAANVTGTRSILSLAKAAGAERVIFISSSSVSFAARDQLGVRESDPLPRPFNDYAASKQAAERLVLQEAGAEAIILRPRGIYGRGDTALLPRLLRAAARGPLPLMRGGHARIDLTHVEDVVEAVLAALQAGPAALGRVYNISGGEVLAVSDIVAGACDRAGVVPRWRKLPLPPLMVAAGLAEAVCRWLPGDVEPVVTRYGLALFAYAQSLDIGLAARDLGWRPRIGFAEGLDMTFAGGAE